MDWGRDWQAPDWHPIRGKGSFCGNSRPAQDVEDNYGILLSAIFQNPFYCPDYRNYQTYVIAPAKRSVEMCWIKQTPSKTLTQTTKFRISPTASFVKPGSLVLGLSKVLLRTPMCSMFLCRGCPSRCRGILPSSLLIAHLTFSLPSLVLWRSTCGCRHTN